MLKYYLCPDGVNAATLSKEIYKIMYPENISVETVYAFGWISKPALLDVTFPDVLMINDEEDFPVFVKSNFQLIMAKIAVVLKNSLLEGEGDALVNKLSTQERINLIGTIPSSFVEVDKQYLYDNNYLLPPSSSLIAELN